MTIVFLRAFFVFLSTVVGYYVGSLLGAFNPTWGIGGAVIGFMGAVLIILVELVMRRFSIRNLSAAVFGLVFGFFMAWLLTSVIRLIPMSLELYASLQIVLILIFCYLGMVIAMRGKDEFNLIIPYVKFVRQDKKDDVILLDTSVIIDGRIADIFQTSFVEGRIVIPRFVLKELQQVADSADPIKRSRGRRGLEVLNQLRQLSTIDVRIHEEDLPGIAETDAKLVKLAQLMSSRVVTNDYNLNKVAELQGVSVLNVNELAQALRPVVLPGEMLEIKPIKEGKEHHQAVAYLDDGTMVVVEQGRPFIGQSIRGMVTSVLQTAAGRMVFVRPENAPVKR